MDQQVKDKTKEAEILSYQKRKEIARIFLRGWAERAENLFLHIPSFTHECLSFLPLVLVQVQ